VVRVPDPNHRDDTETGIRKALRAQEMLYALRAFDVGESIADALWTWHDRATAALEGLEPYLREHRHDDRYDCQLIQDTEEAFRTGYEHALPFRASFGDPVSTKLVKLLRKDDSEAPLPFEAYEDVLEPVNRIFDGWTPTLVEEIENREDENEVVDTYDHLWPLVEAYATWKPIDNAELLDDYRRLLRRRPWEQCPCPICEEYGIEVAIFRGNNRNRRRGFHNTRRFYDRFERDLPKLLVVTRPSISLLNAASVEAHLRRERPEFWNAVHDLPVAEIGVITAKGIHEWWDTPPRSVSFDPGAMADELVYAGARYQDVFVDSGAWSPGTDVKERLDAVDCTLHEVTAGSDLRTMVLDRLGYDEEFVPSRLVQSGLTEY